MNVIHPGKTRLMVNGQRGVGFGIGHVKPGESSRKFYGGPMVPGPWEFAYGLAAVIDNHGGTAREIEEAQAGGFLLVVSPGEEVSTEDGRRYRVEFANGGRDKHNVELVAID